MNRARQIIFRVDPGNNLPHFKDECANDAYNGKRDRTTIRHRSRKALLPWLPFPYLIHDSIVFWRSHVVIDLSTVSSCFSPNHDTESCTCITIIIITINWEHLIKTCLSDSWFTEVALFLHWESVIRTPPLICIISQWLISLLLVLMPMMMSAFVF